MHAVAVLVIAATYALPTPNVTRYWDRSWRGNKLLFKNSEALEMLIGNQADCPDKTEARLRGEPSVTDVVPTTDFHDRLVTQIAASAERGSEHPPVFVAISFRKASPKLTSPNR